MTTATLREAPAAARVALCGSYRHAVDAKGRVAVPAQHRRGLPETSLVGPNADHRLGIWPPDAWEGEIARFHRFAETPAQRDRLERQVMALTFPFEVDAQGRMLLTTAQRSWASITSGAVFLGRGDYVEIVGDQRWDADDLDLDPDEYTRLYHLMRRADDEAPGAAR